ncbi:hypothetical protein WA158_003101 [Blastocystis sp. Blastoise]
MKPLYAAQYRAMMWKNWIIMKRNPKETIWDIMYPVVLIIVLFLIGNTGQNVVYEDNYETPKVPMKTMAEVYKSRDLRIGFSPVNNTDCSGSKITPIINNLKEILSESNLQIECFPSIEQFKSVAVTSTFTAGFHFEDVDTISSTNPNPIKYKILYGSETFFGFSNFTSSYRTASNTFTPLFMETIVPLENTMNELLLNYKSNTHITRSYISQLFPTLGYVSDMKYNILAYTLPMYLALIIAFPYISMTRRLLEEREKRIQEGYLMIGLKENVWWLTWYVSCIFRSLMISIFSGVAFYFIVPKSNMILLIISLFIMSLSLLTLSLGLTSLFDSADSGCGIIFLVLFSTCFPYLLIKQASQFITGLVCILIPPTGIALMGDILLSADGAKYDGITFSNLFSYTTNAYGQNFGLLLVYSILSGLLWLGLGIYLNKVIKHAYGTSEEPCFCVDPKYYKKQKTPYTDNIEPLPSTVDPNDGLRMVAISKVFPPKNPDDDPIVAVRKFTGTFYNNHINVLLGHNGAGKSTLISVLTGLYSPTDGDAFLDGHSLAYEKNTIRRELGVCPQQNVLQDLLTVYEHLVLFARLRNVPEDKIEGMVMHTLEEIDLLDKKDTLIKNLSGGMKRKVNVAIAFIGDPKIVFLDEPTAGMDPVARRSTWTLLEEKKKDHIIVLCTHFMDEADFLADYIYIMALGELQVAGSSLYLKNKFGVGYHLTIDKTERASDASIIQFIKQYIPSSSIEETSSSDLSVLLPREAIHTFPMLLRDLKSNYSSLSIVSSGITATTLEEVFLNLAEEADPNKIVTPVEDNNANKKKKKRMSLKESLSGSAFSRRSMIDMVQEKKQQVIVKEKARNLFDNIEYDPHPSDQLRILLWKKLKAVSNQKRIFIQELLLPGLIILVGCLVLFSSSFLPEYSDAAAMDYNFAYLNETPLNQHYLSYWSPNNNLKYMLDHYYPYTNISTPIMNLNINDENTYLHNITDIGYNAFGYAFEEDTIKQNYQFTIYYNDSFSAILPTSLSITDSMIYNKINNIDNHQPAQIQVSYSSLPSGPGTRNALSILLAGMFGLYTIMGFAFIPSMAAVTIAKERLCGARLQQKLMGVPDSFYWISNILWDYLFCIIPIVIFIVGIAALMSSLLYLLLPAVVIIILCIFASLPFAYLLQFAFGTASSAETGVSMIFTLLYLALMAIGQALSGFESMKLFLQILNYFFYLHPLYSAGTALVNVLSILPAYPEAIRPSPWSLDYAGLACIYLAVEGVLFIYLIFRVEARLWGSNKTSTFMKVLNSPKDEGAQQEIERMKNTSLEDSIQIRNLWKVYPSSNKQEPVKACRDVTFGVKRNECFGLLGPNGAGKTSMLSILTGTAGLSSGTALIDGLEIPKQMGEMYLFICIFIFVIFFYFI